MKPFLEQFSESMEPGCSQALGTQTATHVVSEAPDSDEDFPRPRLVQSGVLPAPPSAPDDRGPWDGRIV